MTANRLFPPVEPYTTHHLAVDAPHVLYVEEAGNPSGQPVVFLHGGPGSGAQASQRQLFDPQRFRIVIFDQRGSGRSVPRGCLEANTTQHLIADMELIRRRLAIERWAVVGGSWGALLAIAYAQAHPQRVTGIVVRALFLGSRDEVDWAFHSGPATLYPELWRQFREAFPEAERADPLAACGARLMGRDPTMRASAAWLWHDYERALSVIRPASLALPRLEDSTVLHRTPLPNTPFLEWHYLRHDCFLAPGQLLGQAARLHGIAGSIVQGRYDMLCPPKTAHQLCQLWPDARLRIVEASGHSASDPGITEALAESIDALPRGDR